MAEVKNQWQQWLTTGLMVAAAFVIGMLLTEVRYLKQGAGPTGAGTQIVGGDDLAAAPTANLAAVRPVDDTDHVRGNANAKITLIEYSDFECPFCSRFHPTMKQVLDEYGDDVRWVYRHYPLSFHPNAQKSAEASECVAEQRGNNGFWSFADAIFAEQDKLGGSLTPAAILSAAKTAGVNEAQFQTCLDSGKYAEKVAADMANGTAAGVTGTPGTIVLTEDGEGEFINGALPIDQVKLAIDRYL